MKKSMISREQAGKLIDFDDDDFELIGKADERSFFISSRLSTIFHAFPSNGMFESFEIFEFKNNEYTELSFKNFALQWAKEFIKGFVSTADEELEKAKIFSNEINEFVVFGLLGEQKYFSGKHFGFYITIIPGGYLIGSTKDAIFVSYEAIMKEIAFKKSDLSTK